MSSRPRRPSGLAWQLSRQHHRFPYQLDLPKGVPGSSCHTHAPENPTGWANIAAVPNNVNSMGTSRNGLNEVIAALVCHILPKPVTSSGIVCPNQKVGTKITRSEYSMTEIIDEDTGNEFQQAVLDPAMQEYPSLYRKHGRAVPLVC
jgi:hypothetical protein